MSISTVVPLPSKVDRPYSPFHAWNTVPLGVGVDGEVTWDITKSPGLLIRSNRRFSGVPTVVRTILAHFADHPKKVRVFSLGSPAALTDSVARSGIIAHNGSGGRVTADIEALQFVVQEMDARLTAMDKAQTDDFLTLPEQPYAMVVLSENLTTVLHDLKQFTEDYYKSLELQLRDLLARISDEGPRAGVYLILGAHTRTDVDNIDDDVLADLMADYNMEGVPDCDQPRKGGRAVFGVEGELPVVVQGYYTHRRSAATGWVGEPWEPVNEG